MNNQSTVNSNSPDLQNLARAYRKDLERLEDIMQLPIGYHLGFARIKGAHGSSVYALDIFHRDQTGETDFDTDIVQGTIGQVETAVRTLLAAYQAYSKANDHNRITPAVRPKKTTTREWHSRLEDIERPTLMLEHDPGFACNATGIPVTDDHFVFVSHNDRFGVDFSVLEDDEHEFSIGMLPADWDWNVETAEELLELSDRAPVLQKWLDDCATVTAWVREHGTIKEADHE